MTWHERHGLNGLIPITPHLPLLHQRHSGAGFTPSRLTLRAPWGDRIGSLTLSQFINYLLPHHLRPCSAATRQQVVENLNMKVVRTLRGNPMDIMRVTIPLRKARALLVMEAEEMHRSL